MRPRVLVVEDDPERREVLRGMLAEEYACSAVGSAEEAFMAIGQDAWAAAVVDYDLAHGGSGLEVLQALREASPGTLRVLYTAYFTESLMRDIARLAHPHAALDARPVDFLKVLRRTLAGLLMVPTMGARAPAPPDPTGMWIAVAPASVRFLADLRRAAESDAPTFLFGEPGAGATQAARLLRDWRAAWKHRAGELRDAGPPPAVILRVPPLRERRQDIPLLAARFVADHAGSAGAAPCRLGPQVLEELTRREWRGNLPELCRVVTRACAKAGPGAELCPADLPGDRLPAWRPSQYAKDDGQRECVLRQLRAARNVSGAARLEGCSRANYIRMMRRLGVLRADVPAEVAPENDADD